LAQAYFHLIGAGVQVACNSSACAGFRPAFANKTGMALNRTLQHLDNADEAADAAKAKLEKQNQRLEKMGGNMNRIHGNLDQTDKEIKDLESNTGVIGNMFKDKLNAFGDKLEQVAEKTGATSAVQSAAAKVGVETGHHGPRFDPGGDTIFEGVLKVRGPQYGYDWHNRWVKVCPAAVFIHTDKDSTRTKEQFALYSGTKCVSFEHKHAPGDSIKHRGEKPFGFCLDVGPPPGGSDRTQHYLDTLSEEEMKKWVKVFSKVGKRLRCVQSGGAASFDKPEGSERQEMLGEEEAQQMDLIDQKLDVLKDKAKDIGEEAKKQAELVDDVSKDVSEATARIQEQDARLKKHINDD